MGKELKIDSEEAFRLASDHDDILRGRLAAIRSITADMREDMRANGKLPSSCHDFLYDEATGLPI